MRRQIIPLVVGVLAGLVALALGYHYLNELKTMNGEKSVTRTILVAARSLTVADRITEGDVKAVNMPQALVPPGAITDPRELVGKSLKVALVECQPILASMIATGTGFGGVIPPGYLAVAVKVDEYTGVAGFLQPGDHVAVMGTFDIRENGKSETVSKIILSNVEVRAVGQQFREDAGKSGEATLVRSVTLLVTPDDAERLQLASTSGRIYLAMQALRDTHKDAATDGITLTKLLGGPEPANRGLTMSSLVSGFFDTLAKARTFMPAPVPFKDGGPVKGSGPPVKEPYVVELLHGDRVEQLYFESSSSDRQLKSPGTSPILATSLASATGT